MNETRTKQRRNRGKYKEHNPNPYRLTISKPNKAYIQDMAKYFHESPTDIINKTLDFLRVENPDNYIAYMKKAYNDSDNTDGSPAAKFKQAYEARQS